MKRHWKLFGCFVGFASYLDGKILFRKESRHFPCTICTLSAIADARLTLLKNFIFIKPESRSGCFPFWYAPSLLPRNYVQIAAVDDALVHVFLQNVVFANGNRLASWERDTVVYYTENWLALDPPVSLVSCSALWPGYYACAAQGPCPHPFSRASTGSPDVRIAHRSTSCREKLVRSAYRETWATQNRSSILYCPNFKFLKHQILFLLH